MTDPIEVVETEEQAAARIRRVKTRRALEQAPSLAAFMRRQVTRTGGHTERGEWKLYQRVPLLTGIADAADELYVGLRGWSAIWAGTLGIPGPLGEMWRNGQTAHAGDDYLDAIALGFRAGTTDERARRLVSRVASWLLWHESDIDPLHDAVNYHDEVSTLISDLRSASGYSRPARRGAPVAERIRDGAVISPATMPCPACGELAVIVEYFGEPMAYAQARGERILLRDMGDDSDKALNEFAAAMSGVSVRCTACIWAPELRPSKIAKWLA